MTRQRNAAILTRLSSELRQHGSWCGETHVQKAVYIMQELFDVPLDFEFILYKHGPFSFELRDELTALRGDEYFELEIAPAYYGPKLLPTERAIYIQERFQKTLRKHENIIKFIATTVSNKGVEELEGLATALYVTKNSSDNSDFDRAEELHHLKPHILEDRADLFVKEIDKVILQAKQVA